MKYKMLITDIDDTLLDNNHKLSAKNKVAIEALQASGGVFVLATGRPYYGMKAIAEEIGMHGYAIAYNGGQIVNLATDEVVVEMPIDHKAFVEVVDFASNNNLSIGSYDGTKIIVSKDLPEARIESELTGFDYLVLDDRAIKAYFEDKKIPKAIIFGPEQAIAKAYIEIAGTIQTPLEFAISKPIFLEVIAPGVHKGAAISSLCKLLNIPVTQTVAAGDGGNDIQMLQTAALGIAVKNARDDLKAVADIVLDATNDEDAIAEIIAKYFK
jgi:HAD-superfamily hydrolase, subfamily IIB